MINVSAEVYDRVRRQRWASTHRQAWCHTWGRVHHRVEDKVYRAIAADVHLQVQDRMWDQLEEDADD